MKITAKLLSLLLVIGFLGGCAGNSSQLETLYENQRDLVTEMQNLKKDLKGTVKMNAELEQELQALERKIENYRRENVSYGSPELTVHENGKLWGEIDTQKEAERSKQNEAESRKKPHVSAYQKLIRIESIDSSDELHQTAEEYYEKGNYKLSILAYQELIDKFPRDSRVPRAYLKQGYALKKMGKSKEAAYFFSGLLNKFPESSEAQLANNELAEIR